MQPVFELTADVHVYTLTGAEATSHLVACGGRSVLVDCHSGQMGRWLARRGLPSPDLILHTQVQPEHCREGGRFPEARLRVNAPLLELATDRAAWGRVSCTRWSAPSSWAVTLGQEPYSIAGAITVFPPDEPLTGAGGFQAGDRIAWQSLVFEVIPLPGHGRHAVGFVLEQAGRPLALFTGDLLCHPAKLVNMYDLEIRYGVTVLDQLPAALRSLAARPVQCWFPATGPAIVNGPQQARTLADAIDAYQEALNWHSGLYTPPPPPATLMTGRYVRRHEGIYQIANDGNCILLIDPQGRGLMFDPGPCDYESEERIANFHRDLDLFEREHGLRTVELAVVTHMHGDHYDMIPELKKRYPGCRAAALDRVAQVIEAPWDYPFPGLLPWYHLGFDHVAVEEVLSTDTPYNWHGTEIRAIHLPGHCYAHAAYLLTFNGLRLAITGDTIQSQGEADRLNFNISNDSVPDAHRGILKAYRQMTRETVDLNLGAHGSHFTDCGAQYAESLRRIEYALPYLRLLVRDGDLTAAFTRPRRGG